MKNLRCPWSILNLKKQKYQHISQTIHPLLKLKFQIIKTTISNSKLPPTTIPNPKQTIISTITIANFRSITVDFGSNFRQATWHTKWFRESERLLRNFNSQMTQCCCGWPKWAKYAVGVYVCCSSKDDDGLLTIRCEGKRFFANICDSHDRVKWYFGNANGTFSFIYVIVSETVRNEPIMIVLWWSKSTFDFVVSVKEYFLFCNDFAMAFDFFRSPHFTRRSNFIENARK